MMKRMFEKSELTLAIVLFRLSLLLQSALCLYSSSCVPEALSPALFFTHSTTPSLQFQVLKT